METRIPRAAAASPLGVLRTLADGGGTPSRLAQFRARNWAGRKRALENAAPAHIALPPKRRAVTALFASEDATQGSREAKDAAVVAEEEKAIRADEDEHEDEESGGSERLALQQELKVGRCLAQELSRDNARLKLKVDGLRDDIDYFYELLAKIEATAQAARNDAVGERGKTLAEAIQRAISAPKLERAGASNAHS
ncbi:hypothetical protein PybrP1_006337 [[Pythium] brassicae (nom. inval.)]|nr:hypothetical protein PybrP1_006337 [[Pythium] brassicae (nom. inval.)]